MSRARNFVERDEFLELLSDIPRLRGGPYEDVATAYGDMSRLVVAWLASTSPDELQALYTEAGWKGAANVRQFHLAAKLWLEKNHPGRFSTDDDAPSAQV